MKIPDDEPQQETHEWMDEVLEEVRRAMISCAGSYCRVTVEKRF